MSGRGSCRSPPSCSCPAPVSRPTSRCPTAEDVSLSSLVESETRRIEADLGRSARGRLQALRRMSHRWETGGATPYLVWRNDARDFVRQLDGLDELQWIGPDYRVQWSEGVRRSGWTEEARHPHQCQVRRARIAASVATRYAARHRAARSGPERISLPRLHPVAAQRRVRRLPRRDCSRAAASSAARSTATAGNSFAFTVKYAGVTYFDNGRVAATNTGLGARGRLQRASTSAGRSA